MSICKHELAILGLVVELGGSVESTRAVQGRLGGGRMCGAWCATEASSTTCPMGMVVCIGVTKASKTELDQTHTISDEQRK